MRVGGGFRFGHTRRERQGPWCDQSATHCRGCADGRPGHPPLKGTTAFCFKLPAARGRAAASRSSYLPGAPGLAVFETWDSTGGWPTLRFWFPFQSPDRAPSFACFSRRVGGRLIAHYVPRILCRPPIFHHTQPVTAITDIPPAMRENEDGSAQAKVYPSPETDLDAAPKPLPAIFDNLTNT